MCVCVCLQQMEDDIIDRETKLSSTNTVQPAEGAMSCSICRVCPQQHKGLAAVSCLHVSDRLCISVASPPNCDLKEFVQLEDCLHKLVIKCLHALIGFVSHNYEICCQYKTFHNSFRQKIGILFTQSCRDYVLFLKSLHCATLYFKNVINRPNTIHQKHLH